MKLTKEELQMVEDNLAFVTYVAKKYFSKTDYAKNKDILQEGILAMIKAVPRYDSNKGKFTTFMYPHIDGHLKRFACYQDRIIPIPHQTHLKKETMEKAEKAKNTLSLDLKYKSSDGEENYTLMSIIPSDVVVDEISINKIIILRAIRELEWREKIVIIYRYYLDLNQTHIGKLMGMSQVHIHRIEKKALFLIKAHFKI